MAKTTLEIVAQVRDAASGPLGKIKKSLEDTGKSAKSASLDFTQFNKVMFSTSAFLGMFQKGFGSVMGAISKGAELGRIQDQFERVLGSRGELITAIGGFTTTSVDQVEAMRSGIALKTLGVANNMNDVAELISGAAVGAKMAGVDVGEGISRMTQSFKDGSLSGLEFLNTIRSADPALNAQLSILSKYSGVLAGAVTKQEKFNLMMNIMKTLARNASGVQEDLLDVISNSGQSFKFLTGEIGRFMGEAIRPLIKNVGILFEKWNVMIKEFREGPNKGIFSLTKNILVLVGALGSLVAVLGTLRLVVTALGFVGGGIPSLLKSVAMLALGFSLLKDNTGDVVDKLKLFGNFVEAVIQMVKNFDPETGFTHLDKDLANILKDNKLFIIADYISRIITIIKTFGGAVFDNFKTSLEWLADKLGFVTDKFKGLFSQDGKAWGKSWIDTSGGMFKTLSWAATGALALVGAIKLFRNVPGMGMLSGLLSKIPFIGKLFGAGGGIATALGLSKPEGTRANPFFVHIIGNDTGGLGGLAAGAMGQFGPTGSINTGNFNPAAGAVLDATKIAVPEVAAMTVGGVIGRTFMSVVTSSAGIAAMILAFGAALGYAWAQVWNKWEESDALENFKNKALAAINIAKSNTATSSTDSTHVSESEVNQLMDRGYTAGQIRSGLGINTKGALDMAKKSNAAGVNDLYTEYGINTKGQVTTDVGYPETGGETYRKKLIEETIANATALDDAGRKAANAELADIMKDNAISKEEWERMNKLLQNLTAIKDNTKPPSNNDKSKVMGGC